MFEDFLTNHGIYADYTSEFERHRTVSLGEFYNATSYRDYIISAFEWDKTIKGFGFWSDVHAKWVS